MILFSCVYSISAKKLGNLPHFYYNSLTAHIYILMVTTEKWKWMIISFIYLKNTFPLKLLFPSWLVQSVKSSLKISQYVHASPSSMKYKIISIQDFSHFSYCVPLSSQFIIIQKYVTVSNGSKRNQFLPGRNPQEKT